ncbi:hypothetical protein J6590_068226 [Homalodisca vitripennis]|nr:hypothetical protein J6590_068226 [Homalodisca vitripennis]
MPSSGGDTERGRHNSVGGFFSAKNLYITSLASNSSWNNLVIDSFTNEMNIHYMESSVSGAHRGFKAEFSSDKPTMCGGQLEDQGSLSFSLLGQNAKYYYCEWRNSRDPMLSNQTTFTVTVNGTLNNMTNIACPVFNAMYDSLIIQDSICKKGALNEDGCQFTDVDIGSCYLRGGTSSSSRATIVSMEERFTCSHLYIVAGIKVGHRLRKEPFVQCTRGTFSAALLRHSQRASGPEARLLLQQEQRTRPL